MNISLLFIAVDIRKHLNGEALFLRATEAAATNFLTDGAEKSLREHEVIKRIIKNKNVGFIEQQITLTPYGGMFISVCLP